MVKLIGDFTFVAGTQGSLDADTAWKKHGAGCSYIDVGVWGKRIFMGQDGADTGACGAAEFDADEGAFRSASDCDDRRGSRAGSDA
jgi:hypothetical protein